MVSSAQDIERHHAMNSFRIPAAMVDYLLYHNAASSGNGNGGAGTSGSGSGSVMLSGETNMVTASTGSPANHSAKVAADGPRLNSLEALHALLECFASARRILEA